MNPLLKKIYQGRDPDIEMSQERGLQKLIKIIPQDSQVSDKITYYGAFICRKKNPEPESSPYPLFIGVMSFGYLMKCDLKIYLMKCEVFYQQRDFKVSVFCFWLVQICPSDLVSVTITGRLICEGTLESPIQSVC